MDVVKKAHKDYYHENVGSLSRWKLLLRGFGASQVQSDHFEEFFAPELERYGYAAVYKKKSAEVRRSSLIQSISSTCIKRMQHT